MEILDESVVEKREHVELSREEDGSDIVSNYNRGIDIYNGIV